MMSNDSTGTRFNALIVDDEPAILNILGQVLQDSEFNVTTAQSGEEAIGVIESMEFDVIMTDVRMQGISGFDLVEHVQNVDPSVKTIVMTGYDSYDMIRKALSTGVYDYLSKPLEDHSVISLCATRAAQATRLVRDNHNLLEQLRASHTLLEEANHKLRKLNAELHVQANTDVLTDLHNRRYLDRTLGGEVARRNRYPDPLSVVMIDVDNFKQFNDKHGHKGGDTVLQAIGSTLQQCARNTDIVGRYGGEEFLVILPKTDPENALLFAERVRKSIAAELIDLDGNQVQVTASVGVSGVNAKFSEVDVPNLVNAADRALYAAKAAGRNCVRQEALRDGGHGLLRAG